MQLICALARKLDGSIRNTGARERLQFRVLKPRTSWPDLALSEQRHKSLHLAAVLEWRALGSARRATGFKLFELRFWGLGSLRTSGTWGPGVEKSYGGPSCSETRN